MEKKEKIIKGFKHVELEHKSFSQKEMLAKSESFYQWIDQRRSVREFSEKEVSKEVIENIIKVLSIQRV